MRKKRAIEAMLRDLLSGDNDAVAAELEDLGLRGKDAVTMSELPQCSFCSREARYDARTIAGPWAYMCPQHFRLHGVGLGLGKGQKLRVRGS